MTTLAIIGNGILGRSLLYILAKEQKSFEKITLLHSDSFAFPCTLHSTAIVAPRGVTAGHSSLGDLIVDAFHGFKEHVTFDTPKGVDTILQFTGATTKLEAFKGRYPQGKVTKELPYFNLKREAYLAIEEAYMVDPESYNDWLMDEAKMRKQYPLEIINDFVIEVEQHDGVHVRTQQGRTFNFDKVVFAGGNYNRFWSQLVPESALKTSKAVQGSYFEFNNVHWPCPSFSLTFEGDNLVWNKGLGRLLIGSTTEVTNHVMPQMSELKGIYQRLSVLVDLNLPDISSAQIKVGLREKARKREPYTIGSGDLFFMGGMYKNGYSLALKMAKNFSHQHL